MKKLFGGNLAIEYGQFYIDVAASDEDEFDEDHLEPDSAFDGQENGLCGASQSGKLFFVTGIQNGVIKIDCEFHDSEPSLEESYGEAVEVSFEVGDKSVSLCEWGHEETHLLALNKGQYRVRYLIQGMDKDYDDENSDDDDSYWELPLEGQAHLVQIWKAENKNDAILRQTTENALYWHREWGNMKAA